MSDGNGHDMPAIARTVSQLGAVGALIVISLWLVYTMVDARAAAEQARLEMLREIANNSGRLSEHMLRTQQRHRETIAMLQAICLVTAGDDTVTRRSCVQGTAQDGRGTP